MGRAGRVDAGAAEAVVDGAAARDDQASSGCRLAFCAPGSDAKKHGGHPVAGSGKYPEQVPKSMACEFRGVPSRCRDNSNNSTRCSRWITWKRWPTWRLSGGAHRPPRHRVPFPCPRNLYHPQTCPAKACGELVTYSTGESLPLLRACTPSNRPIRHRHRGPANTDCAS